MSSECSYTLTHTSLCPSPRQSAKSNKQSLALLRGFFFLSTIHFFPEADYKINTTSAFLWIFHKQTTTKVHKPHTASTWFRNNITSVINKSFLPTFASDTWLLYDNKKISSCHLHHFIRKTSQQKHPSRNRLHKPLLWAQTTTSQHPSTTTASGIKQKRRSTCFSF